MKKFLTAVFVLTLGMSVFGQANYWSPATVADFGSRNQEERWTTPEIFAPFNLDFESLRAELKSSPHENQLRARESYAQFEFPMPDGSMRTFNIVEYEIAEEGLLRKYPHIRAYHGIDPDRGTRIHFNLTKNQLFAVVREGSKTIYIDPYTRNNHSAYVIYDIKENNTDPVPFECDVHSGNQGVVLPDDEHTSGGNTDHLFRGSRGDALNLRTFRLAVSTTFEFTTFYGGTKTETLDGIVTIVNRINSVYEREVAVRMILIADTDKVIFDSADDDPFPPVSNGMGPIISQNAITQNTIIGFNNFDIGHVFGVGSYQGLASLGSVCTNRKSQAASYARTTPMGDAYVINIVCHEMGHQFNAAHTMYHCHNVNNSTAFEPGSGTTIMSYAGICGFGANVQQNADDYYHTNSLQSIIGYSRSSGISNCGTETDFGNTYPDIILDYPRLRIPVRTPFRLTAGATDDETPNTITFNWEQYQNGNRDFEDSPWDIGSPVGEEPLFRSRPPSADPMRYFPELPVVINNSFSIFEQLPTYERQLKFRVNVRDNAPENGGTVWEDLNIDVIDNSADGRFTVTNLVAKDTFQAGGYIEVLWNVAGTDQAPINTQFVDIYLSTDGGESFPRLLKANTRNDGATFVNLPNVEAEQFRIMVAATNSVYFNVSRRSSVIELAEQPALGVFYDDQTYKICAPDVVEYDIATFGMGGFNADVNFEFIGNIPDGGIARFSKNNIMAGESTKLKLDLRDAVESGDFDLTFQITGENIDTLVRTIEIEVVSNDFEALNLVEPLDGKIGAAFVPTLTWTESDNADAYTVQVSDDPQFSNIIFERNNITDLTVDLDIQLSASQVYFWRVKPINGCGEQDINRVNTFQVKTVSCEEFCSTEPTKVISSSGTPSVEMAINTGSSITASDFNVTQIVGFHSDMGQLRMNVEGPDGTKVQVYSPNTCSYVSSSIDMGFDDDAAIVNPNCINFDEGLRFVPKNPLSAFNGINGTTYKLIVDDVQSTSGGRLDSWCFEICGDISPQTPSIILADSISLNSFETRIISSDKLLVTHPSFNPSELTITIVERPIYGTLLLNGVPIGLGSTFTMEQVENNQLSYRNANDLFDRDHFAFIVTDPGAGYVGTPSIEFFIGLSANSNQLPKGDELFVYPNPVQDVLTIELASDELSIDQISIFTVHGKLVSRLNNQVVNQVQVPVSQLSQGVYFLQIEAGDAMVTRKFIKQ